MRSSELARLSGITVRALRHYHQVGILVEPPRSSNDYRDYDVHDLVRVLRIKRLAALGIPLERMHALLDDTDVDSATLLDELDSELSEHIGRLTAQRDLVARLRAHRSPPDLPPELAPFIAMFAVAGMPSDVTKADRDQTVLLAHLAGEEGMPHVIRFYERLSAPDLVPVVSSLIERFARLSAETPDEEADELIETFVITMQPLIAEMAGWQRSSSLDRTAHLLEAQSADLFNARQRDVLAAIERRLE